MSVARVFRGSGVESNIDNAQFRSESKTVYRPTVLVIDAICDSIHFSAVPDLQCKFKSTA